MSIKTIELLVCDKCGKEIKGRLIVQVCPVCHADICLACIEKENASHKPRQRKPKSPSPLEGEGDKDDVSHLPLPGEGGQGDEPEIADKKSENLYIHVPTGLEGDTEYCVNIAGSEASGPTLRLTVLASLEEWSGRIPDELTAQERQTVQGILDAGE